MLQFFVGPTKQWKGHSKNWVFNSRIPCIVNFCMYSTQMPVTRAAIITLLQESQLSWNSWNLKLSWNLIHLVRMSWCWPLLCHSMWPFTVLVATVVTIQCSICNIALVTFLWLQYWSAWLICVHKKYAFSMCLASWDRKNVLKFAKNLVLKFHFLLLGPCYCFTGRNVASNHEWHLGTDAWTLPRNKV